MRKKNGFYYLHPKHICSEIEGFGYEYNMKTALRNYALYIVAGVALGLAYHMQIGYIIAMILLGFLFIPKLIVSTYRNMYDQKRFWDVIEYMDQILTAFKEKKRYLPALSSIKDSFDGSPMYDCITEAEQHLLNSHHADAQMEAYEIIEKQYSCVRLKNIHRYFLSAQALGGDVSDAIAILQTDVRDWEQRQMENQMQRIKQKRNVYYAIVICTIFELCILWALYIQNMDVMQVPLVQLAGVVQWLCALFVIHGADQKAKVDWLDQKNDVNEKRVMEKYEKAVHFDTKREIVQSVRLAIIPAALSLFFWAIHLPWLYIAVMVVLTIIVLFSWKIGYMLAYQDTVRAIRRAFPTWIMDVALRMQTDSVQVALYSSYETAPAVLKPELEKFYAALKDHPTSIQPYLDFLGQFNIRGVSTFMRKIYAIYDGTSDNEQDAILDIVRRNNQLMDEAEREYNEEALAPLMSLFYASILITSAKMMVDMTVMMIIAFANFSQIIG